eukprot:8114640-Heterocapsa_arctica.AAC.1
MRPVTQLLSLVAFHRATELSSHRTAGLPALPTSCPAAPQIAALPPPCPGPSGCDAARYRPPGQ